MKGIGILRGIPIRIPNPHGPKPPINQPQGRRISESPKTS